MFSDSNILASFDKFNHLKIISVGKNRHIWMIMLKCCWDGHKELESSQMLAQKCGELMPLND